MLVGTGGLYRSQGGKKVGPLRPFRDGEDGPAIDIMGRNAWFYAEGIGAYDKNGEWLTGGPSDPNHVVEEWGGPALIDPPIGGGHGDVQNRTVMVETGVGLLFAEVEVAAAISAISKAWIEPFTANTVRLDAETLNSLGMKREEAWKSFREIILAEARKPVTH